MVRSNLTNMVALVMERPTILRKVTEDIQEIFLTHYFLQNMGKDVATRVSRHVHFAR